MNESLIPRVVAAGALVLGGGFWAYQRYQDTRPVDSPVAFETEQQRADNIQAAFAAAAKVEDAEVEGFVARLQGAVRGRDNDTVKRMVSVDRLFDAIASTTALDLPRAARPVIKTQLEGELLDFFDATVVQTDIKRIHRDDEGNLVVYLRMIDENRIMMKSRWWLYPEGDELRWWDSEDLQTGMRLSNAMAVALSTMSGGGSSQRLLEFSEVAGKAAEISMDDPEQVRGLIAELDAVDMESLPRSFRQVGVLLRVSAALAVGEHDDAVQRLDALEAESLDALEMPSRHFLRASIMLGLERWDESAQAARHFLELLGEDAEAYNLLGIAEVGRGDAKAALEAFDKGLADDPLLADNYAGVAYATEDPQQVTERLRPVTDEAVLDGAARWLVEAQDPGGLTVFLGAAKTTHPDWDASAWQARLGELGPEDEPE